MSRQLFKDVDLLNQANNLMVYNKTSSLEFEKKFRAASKLCQPSQLAPALYIPKTDKDCGYGGFFDAGACSNFLHKPDLKDWPKNQKGKPMKYVGSMNLGMWPLHFVEATRIKTEYGWYNPIMYIDHTKLELYQILAKEWVDNISFWMHIFVEEFISFHPNQRDCFIIIQDHTHKKNNDKCLDFIREENAKIKSPEYFNAPKYFFDKPELYFQFNGDKSPDWAEDYDKVHNTPELSDIIYGKSGVNCFGAPYSQQEPKRPLSPFSYPIMRRLTQMVSFHDSQRDFSYQFYADGYLCDYADHSACHCTLDGSCT